MASRTEPRRVLIVAPHFPPVNAPDHQRVRMALPYLAAHGWQAEVLAVGPEFVEAPVDPSLSAIIPPGIRVHRVLATSPRCTRRHGWGSLARRAYPFLRERGLELLMEGRFDLVFFSTSQFGVLPLALDWRRRTGTPYVLDFQDEWISDYYVRHPHVTPPGGRLKYALSRTLARWQEGGVVRQAGQIVVVSGRYKTNLLRRHRSLNPANLHVLQFGGAAEDFDLARMPGTTQDFFRIGNGTNWTYVGRGGPAMRLAATAFFLALQRALRERRIDRGGFRLHCLGTDYATGDRARETFTPLAAEAGVAPQVREQTARLPYFTALRCLREADALVVFGSDDPGYAASKLMPYILARRPLLGIFHQASDCVNLMRETGAGVTVTFTSGEPAANVAGRIFDAWFASHQFARQPVVAREALADHAASEMSRKLCAIFHAASATPARAP